MCHTPNLYAESANNQLDCNAVKAMPDGGIFVIETSNRYLDTSLDGYDTITHPESTLLSVFLIQAKEFLRRISSISLNSSTPRRLWAKAERDRGLLLFGEPLKTITDTLP